MPKRFLRWAAALVFGLLAAATVMHEATVLMKFATLGAHLARQEAVALARAARDLKDALLGDELGDEKVAGDHPRDRVEQQGSAHPARAREEASTATAGGS